MSHEKSPEIVVKPKKEWPNTKNLIPVTMRSKEEARALRVKGGQRKSQRKTLANIQKGMNLKKCHNCVLPCPIKESNLKKDAEHTCSIPAAQRLLIEGYADPSKLDQFLFVSAMDLNRMAKESGSFSHSKDAFQASAKVKELIDPPTQTTISITEDKLNFLQIVHDTIVSKESWKSKDLLFAIKSALDHAEPPKQLTE